MESNIIAMVLISAATVISLFFIIWIIHLVLNNAGVVDVGWGLGFTLIALIYILRGEGFNARNMLMFIMVALWGTRIVFFLIKRIVFEGYEDKRYAHLRNKWGSNAAFKFLWFFEAQALMQILISIPILLISLNPNPAVTWIEILGFVIWMGALYGEALTDEQLQKFKMNPANKGKVCEAGLWKYSRHPNYFFEVLCWFGLFVFGLSSPYGWLGVIAPGIMLYLVLFVTGIPLTEELSLKHRGKDYEEYQKKTSSFIPLPRRTI